MSKTVEKSLSSAIKGTTFIIASAMGAIVLWFIVKVVLARAITKEELGFYSIATALTSALVTIASSGIGEGITRYTSMYLASGEEGEARAASISSINFSILIGLIFSILLYVFAPEIAELGFIMPALTIPLKIISASVMFSLITMTLVSIARGYSDLSPYVINMIGQPVFYVIGIGAVLILSLPFSWVMYTFLITSMLLCALVSIYTSQRLKFNPYRLRGGKHLRKILEFSYPLMGASVVGMIFMWTDTFMLGRYTSADNVGVFNISVTLARTLPFLLSGLSYVLMPIAVELYARQHHHEILRIYQVLTKWVFFITLPLFFILFFFPEPTTTFLFGMKYQDAALPLRILALGLMINVFFGANSTILMVYGLSKTIFNITAASALLNVVLNYILIKQFGLGVQGAAMATSISYIFNSIISAIALMRYNRIHPFTMQYIRPLVFSTLTGLAIYLFSLSFTYTIWYLPLYFVIFISGFVVSFLITRSVDEEDIFLFDSVVSKSGADLPRLRAFLIRFSGKGLS